MKELNKSKKYDLSQLNDVQLQAVLDWLTNNSGWSLTSCDKFKQEEYEAISFSSVRKFWLMEYQALEGYTNALELLNNDDTSVYDDMLSLIEKGKQHGLKIVVTFENL